MATSFDTTYFNSLQTLFHNLIQENKILSKLLDNGTKMQEYFGLGYYNVPDRATIKGKYFVGEAAGFVDAARGFGVTYALDSGVLAAKAIAENKDYDVLWKNTFEMSLVSSFKKRLALQQLTNNDYEKMISSEKDSLSDEEYRLEKQKLDHTFIKNLLIDQLVFSELKKWRSRYDLSKIF